MKRSQQEPESAKQEASLTSSDSLPEFDEIEAEYQSYLASLQPSEEISAKPRKRQGKSVTFQEESVNNDRVDFEPLTPEAIEDMVCFPVNVWLSAKDKKPLSEIERKAFALSTARLANKWLPRFSGEWKEEIGFCICVSTIVFSRFEFKKPESAKAEVEKARETPPVG